MCMRQTKKVRILGKMRNGVYISDGVKTNSSNTLRRNKSTLKSGKNITE